MLQQNPHILYNNTGDQLLQGRFWVVSEDHVLELEQGVAHNVYPICLGAVPTTKKGIMCVKRQHHVYHKKGETGAKILECTDT